MNPDTKGKSMTREVTHDEFWAAVMSTPHNVHPTPEGAYPYTSVFNVISGTLRGREFGRIVPDVPPTHPLTERFYLTDLEVSAQ